MREIVLPLRALTSQVLGNGKAVSCAVISVLVFQNPMSYQSCVGLAITICGVFLYSETKREGSIFYGRPSERPRGLANTFNNIVDEYRIRVGGGYVSGPEYIATPR
eukprot:scaffold764_cov408-Prasinococcus_capsulatus_cf.AAC.16